MKNSVKVTISIAVCFACTLNHSLADTRYVDVNNPTPAAPYTTWSTAANDIQSAVNAAVNGDTVLVADGTYNTTSQIYINKGLTVSSLNGPEVTIIDANNNSRAIRIAVNNGPCELRGLTVTRGYAQGGAAIWLDGNGPITIGDCLIENNNSTKNAGGVSITTAAGQSTDVLIQNCIIRSNSAVARGGGIYISIPSTATCSIDVKDCLLSENESGDDGGGIWCNAPNGSINIARCVMVNNEALDLGGGIRCMRNVLLTDSLIAGNQAGTKGGGEHGGLVGNTYMVNCTVVSNQAPIGGGISRSTVINSIIHGNSANTHPNITADSEVAFSCSPQLTAGVNANINADPQFADPQSGNYRLLMTSPCLDAGTNAFVLSLSDLDGVARIMDGDLDGTPVVDMGAYELFPNHPPVADPGDDQTVSTSSNCTVIVMLDGTGSYDPDGDSITFHWEWAGGSATGETPEIELPLGAHAITLVVSDGIEASEPDTVTITVIDTMPPSISIVATPTMLWPPNHKMVPVEVTIYATDNCDPSPKIELTRIAINEGDSGDYSIADTYNVMLRSERTGQAAERVYTLHYSAMDDSGNSASTCVEIVVPHDQRNKKARNKK